MQVYEGNEKYIFVSYAHKDSEKVIPILNKMMERGFRVWYDVAIRLGSEWPAYIQDRLIDCSVFLAFISPNSVDSENCRDEIGLAKKHKKETLVIYLEKTELKYGLDLSLSTIQSTYYDKYQFIDDFVEAMINEQKILCCRDEYLDKMISDNKYEKNWKLLVESTNSFDTNITLIVRENNETKEKIQRQLDLWYKEKNELLKLLEDSNFSDDELKFIYKKFESRLLKVENYKKVFENADKLINIEREILQLEYNPVAILSSKAYDEYSLLDEVLKSKISEKIKNLIKVAVSYYEDDSKVEDLISKVNDLTGRIMNLSIDEEKLKIENFTKWADSKSEEEITHFNDDIAKYFSLMVSIKNLYDKRLTSNSKKIELERCLKHYQIVYKGYKQFKELSISYMKMNLLRKDLKKLLNAKLTDDNAYNQYLVYMKEYEAHPDEEKIFISNEILEELENRVICIRDFNHLLSQVIYLNKRIITRLNFDNFNEAIETLKYFEEIEDECNRIVSIIEKDIDQYVDEERNKVDSFDNNFKKISIFINKIRNYKKTYEVYTYFMNNTPIADHDFYSLDARDDFIKHLIQLELEYNKNIKMYNTLDSRKVLKKTIKNFDKELRKMKYYKNKELRKGKKANEKEVSKRTFSLIGLYILLVISEMITIGYSGLFTYQMIKQWKYQIVPNWFFYIGLSIEFILTIGTFCINKKILKFKYSEKDLITKKGTWTWVPNMILGAGFLWTINFIVTGIEFWFIPAVVTLLIIGCFLIINKISFKIVSKIVEMLILLFVIFMFIMIIRNCFINEVFNESIFLNLIDIIGNIIKSLFITIKDILWLVVGGGFWNKEYFEIFILPSELINCIEYVLIIFCVLLIRD